MARKGKRGREQRRQKRTARMERAVRRGLRRWAKAADAAPRALGEARPRALLPAHVAESAPSPSLIPLPGPSRSPSSDGEGGRALPVPTGGAIATGDIDTKTDINTSNPGTRAQYIATLEVTATPAERRAAVQRSLPRRPALLGKQGAVDATATMRRPVSFSASRVRALVRLAVWFYGIGGFVVGSFVDRLFRRELHQGKSRRQRSAERLRRAFERMGGTAIKIGQQAAMRLDLLPVEYCNELSRMLDKVPAFPSAAAVAAVERTAGRPIYELFSAFDPRPIGAASVSCVYKAILHDGSVVAVKVRRPGIGQVFMADCLALEWILRAGEMLTVIRPGFSKNLVVEFRTMLIEELDFTKEARHGELFRRRVKKAGMRFVTAPKVYFAESSDEVMISEFVEGVWVSEVVGAVERKDPKALAVLERLRISPRAIACRLMEVNQFSVLENILFHADPHPANILVQPDNRLVFIDFGSCGAYSEKERHVWRRLLGSQAREDVGEMVQCALAILEPLPPIDIDEFSRKLEAVFWQDLYAFRSKNTHWWERTSARIWFSFLQLAREYSIPMNLNTLRMIRSTLLYDTIAARLYNRIDAYAEHQKFLVKAGARAERRARKQVRTLASEGPPKAAWLRLEHLTELSEKLVYSTQRLVDDARYRFAQLPGKPSYAALVGMSTIYALAIPAGALLVYYLARGLIGVGDGGYGLGQALRELGRNRAYLGWVVLVVLLNMRKVGFRLRDKEING